MIQDIVASNVVELSGSVMHVSAYDRFAFVRLGIPRPSSASPLGYALDVVTVSFFDNLDYVKRLSKGDKVIVRGRVRDRRGRDGRWTTSVVGDYIAEA